MLRNLCKIGLGVAGRQNEMIELALTNGFRSIEIDMDDMLGRAVSFGNEFACQFVNSCKVSVGIFQLPVDFGATDEKYAKFQSRIDHLLEICEDIGAQRCYAIISPAGEELPYHENFERQRERITEIAQKLATKDIRLGLALDAFSQSREGKSHQFICTAEDLAAFVKAIGQPNVGIALDTFQWTLGGGNVDQLEQLNVSSIVDVRLSDCSSEKDAAKVTNVDRQLPGSDSDSICEGVYNWLQSNDYDGPIAACASATQLTSEDSQAIVQMFKRSLDKLDGSEVEQPTAEAAEAAEPATETKAGESKKQEPVATESS